MTDHEGSTNFTFGLFGRPVDEPLSQPEPLSEPTDVPAVDAPLGQERPTGVLLVEALADALRLPDRDVRWRAEDALNRLGPAIADGLRASAERVAA